MQQATFNLAPGMYTDYTIIIMLILRKYEKCMEDFLQFQWKMLDVPDCPLGWPPPPLW